MGDDEHDQSALRIAPRQRELPEQVVELTGRQENRRSAERLDAQIPVPVCIVVASAHTAIYGETVNVSDHGCFIVSETPLPLGSLIDLEIQLADAALLLHASGIVVRQGERQGRFGMGVHFSAVSYGAQVLVELIRAEGLNSKKRAA